MQLSFRAVAVAENGDLVPVGSEWVVDHSLFLTEQDMLATLKSIEDVVLFGQDQRRLTE